jgi:hypothetical protein
MALKQVTELGGQGGDRDNSGPSRPAGGHHRLHGQRPPDRAGHFCCGRGAYCDLLFHFIPALHGPPAWWPMPSLRPK